MGGPVRPPRPRRPADVPHRLGHVTHLPDRDHGLLEHIDVKTLVGDPARIQRDVFKLGSLGFAEIIYTPSGPDVARELRAFASARVSAAHA